MALAFAYTRCSKCLTVNLLYFGKFTIMVLLNSLSTEAEDGKGVLYFMKVLLIVVKLSSIESLCSAHFKYLVTSAVVSPCDNDGQNSSIA